MCLRMILHEWPSFYRVFLSIHRSGVLTALTWPVPYETAAVSARSVYTIQPCTMSLHAKPRASCTCVFSCNLPPALLAEWPGSFTCYRGNTGWNGDRSKSQHRKLTLAKKILPPLLQGLEPGTFQSRAPPISSRWRMPDVILSRTLLTYRIKIKNKVKSSVSRSEFGESEVEYLKGYSFRFLFYHPVYSDFFFFSFFSFLFFIAFHLKSFHIA